MPTDSTVIATELAVGVTRRVEHRLERWPGRSPFALGSMSLQHPGVGKTHLAQAIGYEAIKMNFQVLYRSIFDLA